MIWWALGATGAALLTGLLAWQAAREARKQRQRANSYAREIDRLGHVIRRMEEVYREANERKDKMATGSPTERFDATRDVLSDISRGHSKHRD